MLNFSVMLRPFIFISFLLLSKMIFAQNFEEVPLYNKLSKDNPDEIKEFDKQGNLTHVSGTVSPRLLVFRPDSISGTGLIVCPGSGYIRMNIENTRFIANRLNKLGITVFVLVHRLPSANMGQERSVAALKDLQSAIHLVRQRAGDWGLSPDKIGVWGSSAGGHLAAMAGTHFSKKLIKVKEEISLRPDFLILAWPVISFRPELVHKGSMINLLGENPSQEEIAYFSADERVDETTPITFLVHAADDGSVPFKNSIRFFEALRKAGVNSELHIYEKGGHTAFRLAPEIPDKDSWVTQLGIWLRNNGY
jgi:acetyl esterase/lipase